MLTEKYLLICVAAALVAGGCASARVTTDLRPDSNPALQSPAGMFYVAGLKYVEIWPGAGTPRREQIREYNERLLPAVRTECAARYPMLFARDSANAIPLWVEVNDAITDHPGKLMAWMLCTACLAGTIFPAPYQMDHEINVKAGVWNGRDGAGGGIIQKEFRREDHAWLSMLTPLGLIHMPGKSDFPKVSTAFDLRHRCAYDDVPQISQQVATALAEIVAAQDPAHWTTRPQEWTSPGVAPAAQEIPSATPPPMDQAAPF